MFISFIKIQILLQITQDHVVSLTFLTPLPILLFFWKQYSLILVNVLISTTMHVFGEGNGNSLWYSCLENSVDRGACRARVHRVTKGWTRLSDWAHACIISAYLSTLFWTFWSLLLLRGWVKEEQESKEGLILSTSIQWPHYSATHYWNMRNALNTH